MIIETPSETDAADHVAEMYADDRDDVGFVFPYTRAMAVIPAAHQAFEDLLRALLAGVYLVEDLREVLRVYGGGRIPATFVTPNGDLLSSDGVIRGGAGGAGGHLARAREVRELESEVAQLESRIAERGSAHHAARSALAAASDELENLRNRHHTAALAVANHEKDIERTRERVKALGEAHEGRKSERSDLLAGIERGVWVTRFWYVNVVHPLRTILTGMTRDGTFLIENGEITRAVRNFRFTTSVLDTLASVEDIGREPLLLPGWFGGSLVPALRVGRFQFSGVTEF